MPKISEEKIAKLYENIVDFMKKAQDEEAKSTYVLIKTRNLKALSSGLNGIISDVDNLEKDKIKEMLRIIKAGVDWAIENKSIPPDEARKLERNPTPPPDQDDRDLF